MMCLQACRSGRKRLPDFRSWVSRLGRSYTRRDRKWADAELYVVSYSRDTDVQVEPYLEIDVDNERTASGLERDPSLTVVERSCAVNAGGQRNTMVLLNVISSHQCPIDL
jgi:hypothetical protein